MFAILCWRWSNVRILTGTDGEIRRDCRRVN
ncbi:BnaC02g25130D [Brassica napus]|uniref:BnaC02g25130D protein n=1 Tax=Brassica napus TaxID=3708 RepID=A0A078FJL1_BRANA|nr:BnaC02g25130D [Brassica napus]